MIVDISNEVYTELKSLLSGVLVIPSYPQSSSEFPCVSLEEKFNQTNLETIDTSGEKHNDVSYELNIFTTGSTKMTDAKTIRNTIDGLLADTYRMKRTFSDTVPNYLDSSIYRYVLRYNFSIDSNKTIYK